MKTPDRYHKAQRALDFAMLGLIGLVTALAFTAFGFWGGKSLMGVQIGWMGAPLLAIAGFAGMIVVHQIASERLRRGFNADEEL